MAQVLHIPDKQDQDDSKSNTDAAATDDTASASAVAGGSGTCKIAEEVEKYFGISNKKYRSQTATNPCSYEFENVARFWRDHEKSLPVLSKLAKKCLSTPASSVYSERLFSEYGAIFEEKRSRLLPRNGQKILFLHHNFRIQRREEAAKVVNQREKLAEEEEYEDWGLDLNLSASPRPRDFVI